MADRRARTPSAGSSSLIDAAQGWFGMSVRPGSLGRRASSRGAGGGGSIDWDKDGGGISRTGSRTEVGGGSKVMTGRKVRTVPPFASQDPPSPPQSPHILPSSAQTHTTTFSHLSSKPSISSSSRVNSPANALNPSQNALAPVLSIEGDMGGGGGSGGVINQGKNQDQSSHAITEEMDHEDAESLNAPPQWWTFALPSRHHQNNQQQHSQQLPHGGGHRKQTFRTLQAAWNDTIALNKGLREESEHYGRDYFSSKGQTGTGGEELSRSGGGGGNGGGGGSASGSGMNTPNGNGNGGGNGRMWSGMTWLSNNGNNNNNSDSPDGSPSGTATPTTRQGRFRGISGGLPGSSRAGSRRHSTAEGHTRFSLGGGGKGERSFLGGWGNNGGGEKAVPVFEEPEETGEEIGDEFVEGLDPGDRTGPSTPKTPPPRRAASTPTSPIHPTFTKREDRRPFRIALPTPSFSPSDPNIKTRMIIPIPPATFRAQGPPTPIGWDRPWQTGLKSFNKSKEMNRQAFLAKQGIAPASPWSKAANADHTWGDLEGDVDDFGGEPIGQRETGSTTLGGGGTMTDSIGRGQGGGKRSGWWSGKGRARDENGHGYRYGYGKGEKSRRRVVVVEKPKTRSQRLRQFLIFDARSAIGLKVFCIISLAVALGLSISIRSLDKLIGTDGIIGSSPFLTLVYAPPTILHSIIATYREAFGKPIGLWGMRSRMIWVCFDLFFISIWASDLSLAISDFITTPLLCSSASPWWTSYSYRAIELNAIADEYQDRICNRHATLIAFVLLVTICHVSNMILSLFRILERLATLHKAYEMGRNDPNSMHFGV